jgi:hypothetical protein
MFLMHNKFNHCTLVVTTKNSQSTVTTKILEGWNTNQIHNGEDLSLMIRYPACDTNLCNLTILVTSRILFTVS